MIVILTSNLGHYYELDNTKISKEVDNTNHLVDHIKKYISKYKGILFIPSSSNTNITNMYANILFDSLKLSGITFDNYYILDDYDKLDEYINNSSLIFLSGGNTYEQHLLFEKIKLKELLNNYDELIIGQSAGSMNLAKNVFNSDVNSQIYFEGLGLTDINVEPHFDIDNIDELVIKESFNRVIYGLPDISHILITGDSIEMYGDVYTVKNGIVKKYK